MNKDDKWFDWVEKYSDGELAETEREVFEARLKSDALLQEKLEIYNFSKSLIIQNRLREVKGLLEKERTRNQSMNNIVYSIIALCIISGGVFYFLKGDKKTVTENDSISLPAEILVAASSSVTIKQEPVIKGTKEGDIESVPAFSDSGLQRPLINPEFAVVADVKHSTALNPVDSGNKVRQSKPETNITEIPTSGSSDPCDGIAFEIQTKPACEGASDGAILISEGRNNVDFTWSVNDLPASGSSFHDLVSGAYKVEIVSSTGCRKLFEKVKVAEKACRRDYHFNPYYGQKWEVPVYEKRGNLTIFDKGGRIWFERQTEAGEHVEWSGESSGGELKPGYYLFLIKYEDGRLLQGSVTIAQ